MSVNEVKNVNPLSVGQCKTARAVLEWSQTELSAHAKVGSATIANFEAGRSKATPATRAKLLGAFAERDVTFSPDGLIVQKGDQQWPVEPEAAPLKKRVSGKQAAIAAGTDAGWDPDFEAQVQPESPLRVTQPEAVKTPVDELLEQNPNLNKTMMAELMQSAGGDPTEMRKILNALANPVAEDPLEALPMPVDSGLPHDLFTHRNSFRAAIARVIELSPPDSFEEGGERSYWEHELAAYDQMHAEFVSMLEQGFSFNRDRLYMDFLEQLATRSFTGVTIESKGSKTPTPKYRLSYRGVVSNKFVHGNLRDTVQDLMGQSLKLPPMPPRPQQEVNEHVREVAQDQFVALINKGWVQCGPGGGVVVWKLSEEKPLYLKPPMDLLSTALLAAPVLHTCRQMFLELIKNDPEFINEGVAVLISSATELLEQIDRLSL